MNSILQTICLKSILLKGKQRPTLSSSIICCSLRRPLSAASGDSGNTSEKSPKSNSKVASEIEVGQSCTVKRAFSAADLEEFARLTSDYNPVHFDDRFAGRLHFASAIVHGALINGVISATIGTILPGPGSILLQQDLHFPNPLYVGEEFVTRVTIANKRRNIYFCRYECTTTAEGKKVVEGMAKILLQPQQQPEN